MPVFPKPQSTKSPDYPFQDSSHVPCPTQPLWAEGAKCTWEERMKENVKKENFNLLLILTVCTGWQWLCCALLKTGDEI